MIRIIARTLLYIVYGKLLASDSTDTFENLARSKIGTTRTPNGLMPEKLHYETIE